MKNERKNNIKKRMTAADKTAYNLSMDSTPKRTAVYNDTINRSFTKRYKKSGSQKRK
jgi:hypothetical protein